MDRLFTPPVSIEQFAAYLDGNLLESQMHEMDMLIASNPAMEELAEMSDVIAEDTQLYLNDDFAYETDMAMLDEQDFDIPCIDFEDGLVLKAADVFYEYADIEVAACACEEEIISHELFEENESFYIDNEKHEESLNLDDSWAKEKNTGISDGTFTHDDENFDI